MGHLATEIHPNNNINVHDVCGECLNEAEVKK